MSRTEESFADFVQKPPRPAMPAFSDVAAKDLADVYAYLRSLHSTAPAAESIPLLNDILQQIAAAGRPGWPWPSAFRSICRSAGLQACRVGQT